MEEQETEELDILVTKYDPEFSLAWNHVIGPVFIHQGVISKFDKRPPHELVDQCVGTMVRAKLRKITERRKQRAIPHNAKDCDWEAVKIVKVVSNKFKAHVLKFGGRNTQSGVVRVDCVDAVCLSVVDDCAFLFCEKLGEIKVSRKFTKNYTPLKPMQTYVLGVKFSTNAAPRRSSTQPSEREVYWHGEVIRRISDKKFPAYFTTLYNFFDGVLDSSTPASYSRVIKIPGMSANDLPIYFDYSDVYLYEDASKLKAEVPLTAVPDLLVQAQELKGYCTMKVFHSGRPWRVGRRALFVAPVPTCQKKESQTQPPIEENLISLEDSEIVTPVPRSNESGLGSRVLGSVAPLEASLFSLQQQMTNLSLENLPSVIQQKTQNLLCTSIPGKSVSCVGGSGEERIRRVSESGGGGVWERGMGGGNGVDLLGSLDEGFNSPRLPPPLSPPIRLQSRANSTPSLPNYGKEDDCGGDGRGSEGNEEEEGHTTSDHPPETRSTAEDSTSSRISDDVSSLCPSEEGSGGSGSGSGSGGGGGEKKEVNKNTVESQTEDIKELQVIRRMLADESIFDVISTKRPDILRDIITIIAE